MLVCSYLSICTRLQLSVPLRAWRLYTVGYVMISPSPGASSEIRESQIALPSFLRPLAKFTFRYLIEPSEANYPHAAIYPFAY